MSATDSPAPNAIAIVGMAGRFPGAPTLERFWSNLRGGIESVTFFTDEELVEAGVDESLVKDPRYVKAKALLEGAETFDAAFFGYTPREAEQMDPQQRLFLECAWEAFESAGYDPRQCPGATGVFAGTNLDTYLLQNVRDRALDAISSLELRLGSDNGFLATRAAYKLNLRGPAITVQTACSTSLVAVCQACQSLATYQCDMALAGASTVKVPRNEGYRYQENGIASPDGHCRAFDADAKGTFPGEGVAAVVLKRLDDAIADGDTIRAVIRGWALNNDGDAKVGYTAPSVAGQAEVIAAAHALAGIEAETVSYVEAHGTGTELGDPIEIAALTHAFAETTDKKQFCALGSVKTNIGHLDAAAGIAGLIKTVLALEAGELLPHLHFRRPNPRIDFAASPFVVNTELTPWTRGSTPRRAGVSSFGIGGTNAHVVLEEAPAPSRSDPARPHQLLLFSARSAAQLATSMDNFAAWLKSRPDANLADVAHTLRVGRRPFQHAAMLVCRDAADALGALDEPSRPRIAACEVPAAGTPVLFMFPGQGNQYVDMGLGLYRTQPAFRRCVDECCDVLAPELGLDLRAVLFPPEDAAGRASEQLKQTRLAQPALFVVEYALARLLMGFGVQPHGCIGHSIGEYVAACLAGVFSVEDALRLVAARGRLMQSAAPGAMTAVALSADALSARLDQDEDLSLAAVNEPALCVASGPVVSIERLEQRLAAERITCRRLQTSHAFHSRMMEPIAGPFRVALAGVRAAAPTLPVVSNVTGTWMTAAQAIDPGYWAAHLRETVRFADGIGTLLERPAGVLLELGPGRSLGSSAQRHAAYKPTHRCLAALRHARDPRDDREHLLECIGRLRLAGIDVDWHAFVDGEKRRRVPLPTYPFERKRYWLPGRAGRFASRAGARADVPARRPLDECFYVPSWKRGAPVSAPAHGATAPPRRSWLVFADRQGVGARLSERLLARGDRVFTVRAGTEYAPDGGLAFRVSPREPAHIVSVLESLRERGDAPDAVLHLWALDDAEPGSVDDLVDRCFFSPLYVAQAFGATTVNRDVRFGFVSADMHVVTGDEPVIPEKALLLGPCSVIEDEYPNIRCRSIDLASAELTGRRAEALLDAVAAEIDGPADDRIVALRGAYRWTRDLAPLRLAAADEPPARLRRRGVYLITGGLGGIGMALAADLARTVEARLVLVGRSALPAREQWGEWLAAHSEDDDVSRKIRGVLSLESLGSEVIVAAADVSRADQMRDVVERARSRFGAIHGVVHSAGIAGGGVMQLKTREQAARVLAPKVHGTRVLEDVLGGESLDFLVLCSSLITTVGGAGQVDYIAANAFLDAYAHARTGGGRYTVAIDWDTWRDVGMALETDVPDTIADARARRLRSGLTAAEGAAAFERILRHGLPQVAVSARAPDERKPALTVGDGAPDAAAAPAADAAPSEPRRTLSNPYTAPRDDLERTLVGIWEELFGIDGIGVEDGFFDLGGHSLLAIQIVSRINAELHAELTLNGFFEAPDVARLAERLRRRTGDDDIEAMVAQLTDEEVRRMLAERQATSG